MFAFCPDSLKTEKNKQLKKKKIHEAVPGYLLYDEQKYLFKSKKKSMWSMIRFFFIQERISNKMFYRQIWVVRVMFCSSLGAPILICNLGSFSAFDSFVWDREPIRTQLTRNVTKTLKKTLAHGSLIQ